MPQPGALPPTGYLYLEVAFSDVRQQSPVFGIFASAEPYGSIEAFAKGRCISNVYRRDLIDRSRVYRFPNTSLRHFTEDKCKPGEFFLQVGPDRFYLQNSDPSSGKAEVRVYEPIG